MASRKVGGGMWLAFLAYVGVALFAFAVHYGVWLLFWYITFGR